MSWLERAVFYQVYPQSFADANGDGIGDIRGLIQKLPYIKELGCDAVWINPWFVSPFQDAGYDVADYYRVAPRYGDNADARRLFRQARKLGLRIFLDLVPGHTSIAHPWFRQSCRARRNRYSDWYIWTESVWTGAGPDLESVRGFGERDGAYVTNFFYSQPALNYGFAKPDPRCSWQQPVTARGPRQVAGEMLKIMRFWLRQGAAGFRVDMAGSLVKNDPGQRATMRLWRRLADRIKRDFPDAVLISEWGLPARALRAGFDVDFMLHFPTPGYRALFRDPNCYFSARSRAGAGVFLREFQANLRAGRGRGFVSVPSGNHDMDRLREGRGPEDLKVCFALLLTLPSVPFIYYGDEIGMRKLPGLPSKEGGYHRTGSRTPMQWAKGRNLGFSSAPPNRLYLPVDPSPDAPTVAAQKGDPNSLWETVRGLIALRRTQPALRAGAAFRLLHDGSRGRPLVFLRLSGGERLLVAVHPKAWPARLKLPLSAAPEAFPLAALRARLRRAGGRLELVCGARSYGIFRI